MNNLNPMPDAVKIISANKTTALEKSQNNTWIGPGIEVSIEIKKDSVSIDLYAPKNPLKEISLYWNYPISNKSIFLSDHWERAYGDLGWKSLDPARKMPWYFFIYDGKKTDSFGVKTGCNSICYWKADEKGISLTMDVRSGSRDVVLGDRTFRAAEIVFRAGKEDAKPFGAAVEFCKSLCGEPLYPPQPIYGVDDWYYWYGMNSEEKSIRGSEVASDLSENTANRPFSIVDAGWQFSGETEGGPWIPSDRFTRMDSLAEKIKRIGCKPGIWYRPLLTDEKMPEYYFRTNKILDPSVPEVMEKIKNEIKLFKDWGYDLIKHDFSAFDMFDLWGFEMEQDIYKGDVVFQDRSKTTAEITLDMYRAMRQAAGNTLILACNTIGHLAAGLAEIQRVGDDTSGKEWERTKKMGVNCLAFRMPQHKAFFSADADCVGLTNQIPWSLNKQWMELLAESGTQLLISAEEEALGNEQKQVIKNSFSKASRSLPSGEPLDWFDEITPKKWKLNGKIVEFDWEKSI